LGEKLFRIYFSFQPHPTKPSKILASIFLTTHPKIATTLYFSAAETKKISKTTEKTLLSLKKSPSLLPKPHADSNSRCTSGSHPESDTLIF
jgi:hypothetical protein